MCEGEEGAGEGYLFQLEFAREEKADGVRGLSWVKVSWRRSLMGWRLRRKRG